MNVLFCDGFELYDTTHLRLGTRWTGAGLPSFSILGSSYSRFGVGQCLEGIGQIGAITRGFGGEYDDLILQAAVRFDPSNPPSSSQFLQFFEAATLQVYLDWESTTGTIRVMRYGSVILGVCTGTYATGVWHFVEMRVVFHATLGTVVVKVNGSEVANLDHKLTAPSGNAWATGIGVLGIMATGGKVRMDDMAVLEPTDSADDFIGDKIVRGRLPIADGYYSQWDTEGPSSAAGNYEAVDDTSPDGDSTYNYTSTSGLIDTFDTDAIPTTGDVFAVMCEPYARIDDAGPHTIKGVIRSNGTDGTGSSISLPSGYNWGFSPIYVDPATGTSFTPSAVNSAEKGYKLVS